MKNLIAALVIAFAGTSAFAADPAKKPEEVKKPAVPAAVPATPKETPKVDKPKTKAEKDAANPAKDEKKPVKSEPAKKDAPKADAKPAVK